MSFVRMTALTVASLGVLALAHESDAANRRSFIKGEVTCTSYDGVSDDLLTGGLGRGGLLGAAPALSSPPTAAELRRLAIYNNYRALIPIDPGGGYGTLFGPNIDRDGNDTLGEGLVAGTECLAFAGSASGHQNVTVMVQVPASFDPGEACIVTAPSSGSRGVYGAIGTAGEWGLRNGCAVAYTDKGTGNGAHNLETDTVNLITGERVDADAAGKDAAFTARLNDRKRADFNAATPNRFAYKHAHSRQNPEAQWGRDVLQSIKFAFSVLNDLCESGDLECDQRIKPSNTIVIASSVSNGAGASVRAAEQDREGLIDGVAVSEPNVNPRPGGAFGIQQGDGPVLTEHSRSLLDYTTVLNIFQGCANLAPANAAAPFNVGGSAERCQSLAEKGMVSGATVTEQAEHAQAIINSFGILPEQNITQPSNYGLLVPQAIGVTYVNAYGRFSVARNLCGYSFGATDGANAPTALSLAAEEALFGTGNGIPPTGGVNIINNDSVGGPLRDQNSISPSTGRADQNLDGALCARARVTGRDPETGARLRGVARSETRHVAKGIRQVRASGNLHGKPAVFVTGRNDAILAPNHTSRAYVGLNHLVEGSESDLHYYEVLNAHHLDALTILDVLFDAPLFSDKFVPLHHYLFQALDLMIDHLRNGTPLPPSQVVRAVPRGIDPAATPPFTLADVPAITVADNLPSIAAEPAAGDRIVFEGSVLRIPD